MGPMNYEVRAFSWEDINNYFDQIVEMQRENIYEFHYPEKEPKIEYIVAKLRELENFLNKGNSHFIGALKEGELCGYIWCYESVFLDEKRMNINSLFVREKDRQSGVGHLLVNEIKAIASNSGCVSIATHKASYNTAAGAFYKKNGFDVTRIEVVCKLK